MLQINFNLNQWNQPQTISAGKSFESFKLKSAQKQISEPFVKKDIFRIVEA